MQSLSVLQALILAAAVAAGIYVVIRVSEGWADYAVLAVIVLTTLGAARAIYTRRYPTKKRTFIRSSRPGPRL